MHKSSNLQAPVISEKDAQKKLEPLLQIQSQNRHMNHDFAGMLQLRGDPSQRIAPLADSETAFNIASFTRFQPFEMKLLLPNRRILWRFTKPRTVEMDAVFLAVLEILPCAVDGIRQHTCRIVPIGFAVGLHRILERVAFVERVPAEMLDPQKSVDIAHPDLRAEFNRSILLPPHNGTHPGLTETDDL